MAYRLSHNQFVCGPYYNSAANIIDYEKLSPVRNSEHVEYSEKVDLKTSETDIF